MREWLKNARSEKGLTQEELAKRLDITPSYYGYIENGTRQKNMDLKLAQKLSDTLGLPMDRLIAAEEDWLQSK